MLHLLRIAAVVLAIAVGAQFHVTAVSAQVQSDELAALDVRVSELHTAGKYAEAIPVAEEYVALAKSRGEDRPEHATAMRWLGELYRKGARDADAEPLLIGALAIDEKAFGSEHPIVARDLNSLASLRFGQGRDAEAEALFKRAFALREKALGPEHPDVGESLNNLAKLLREQGRYADSEALSKRALALNEAALGPEHPQVGESLNNLAVLNRLSGHFKDAEPLGRRALSIREKALGSEHPAVAESLNNLALLYGAQGYFAEAEPLLERALAIEEKVFGAEHPNVGWALKDLAMVYAARRRFAEAQPLLGRALTILQSAAGPEHPDVAAIANTVAMVFGMQGRYAEAETAAKLALTIHEKAFGRDHSDVAQDLMILAAMYTEQNRYAEAEPVLKRALSIYEKAFGPQHMTVAVSLFYLALLDEYQIKLKDAEARYRRALNILEKAAGRDHLMVAYVRQNLGGLYKSQGRRSDAEPLLESALAIKEKVLGPDHPDLASALAQLADLYRVQGRCDKAEPVFLRARALGAATIQEVPVLFGTDRKRDSRKPSVAFGGEREGKLSFGLAVVTVPKEQTAGSVLQQATAAKSATPAERTEARRLAMHCIEVVSDKEIVEAAVRRLGDSKTHPSQALLFVHGYNVSFENAVRRTAQIAYDIKFDGGTFLFSWPSRGRLMDYFSDRETVDLAAEHLREFLEKIVGESKVTKIHFVAHSMGNMVLLRALEKIASEGSSLRAVIGEVIHAAPDVDPDLFVQIVRKVKAKGASFTLYASRSDRALWVSGWMRDRPRAGFIKDQPLITAGVDTIDITDAGTDLFALNHDIYSASPTIVGDMRRIIEAGERPPDKRTKELEAVPLKDGTYWRLRAQRAEAPAR